MGVIDCSDVGVVCNNLSVEGNGKSLEITGKFGVFYEGSLGIHYLDVAGRKIHAETVERLVSPLKAIVLSITIPALENTASVSLHLYDNSGKDMGQLALANCVR